jgi:DNA-3-methyladenine glycosylase
VARPTEEQGADGWVGPSHDPRAALTGPAEVAARWLLGSILVSSVGGEETSGRIVEVEAYPGPHDPASHAASRIGRTPRNDPMFGPAGSLYVYRIYGMHWCLNVVTGPVGEPAAVLVRALAPLSGEAAMARRRGGSGILTSGPGRLCQALGVDASLNRHDLRLPPLRLVAGPPVPHDRVATSGRIGIREARDWPLRFRVLNDPHVSGSPR